MNKIKSYTDIIQSKKLLKIGLNPNTADMCYKCIEESPYDIVCKPYSDWKKEHKGLLVDKKVNVIPSWSLAALINMLPSSVKDDVKIKYYLNIEKNYIEYINLIPFRRNPVYIYTEFNDNLLDSCVEMIIKLKENNFLYL